MEIKKRTIPIPAGESFATPLFLPVYEEGNPFISMDVLQKEFPCRGIICNAYFLYRKREIRKKTASFHIKEYLDFKGLVVTDSGAFQALAGPLYLSNSRIIRFQQDIGADIISPLDLITPPGDSRKAAAAKLGLTMKRIRDGVEIADRAVLIGVQQGGRFLDLRIEALEKLSELPLHYYALGSLVPFLNRNHDISFVGKNILAARQMLSEKAPLHLYGAGDPLELPFFMALGCDVFDSSSYLHYARGGWYMTPYGALQRREDLEKSGFSCACPLCREDPGSVMEDRRTLAKHNLAVIYSAMETAERKSADGTLPDYLLEVIKRHQALFPDSLLEKSWNELVIRDETIGI